jgi:uncharacterized protein (TIGR02231 family)
MNMKITIAGLYAGALSAFLPVLFAQDDGRQVTVPLGPRIKDLGDAPPLAPKPFLIDAPAVKARVTLPITEVTVYEDRALVSREGEVKLAQGVQTVLVGGLPPALLETSLRAGLAGAEGRVISVSSDTEEKREIQDAKLRAVDEKRKAMAREIAALEDELARIASREAYLDAYEKLVHRAVSERTGGYAKTEVESWGKALQFVRDGRSAAQAARRDAEAKRELLSRDLGDVTAEAERLRKPAERSERSAEVTLEASAAGGARVRLSYVIEGAGWSPRYDARFDPEKSELAVTYFGEVRQRTGEDWNDAKLALSTARPSVGASRPPLQPVRLTSAVAQKGIDFEKLQRVNNDDVPAGGMMAVMNRGTSPDSPLTEVRESATAATFSVPGTATIPADGRPHKVPVVTFRERAETSFETVPRLQKFVYLKCEARNGSAYPMLAGPVDIFRASGFIGTSGLKFVAPGRPFDVSLGIEESLKVRRATTFDAFTGRGKEKRQGYDIEVANFGEKRQAVTVIESYPVSDIEDVRVKLDPSTTAGATKDEKQGILRWRLDLAPGESKVVHLEYTIEYPKNYTGS